MQEDSNTKLSWYEIVSKYNHPSSLRGAWQIVNSVGPFLIVWYFMYQSLSVSYWLTILLSFIAAGFSVRIFIIFHDCGHGSFYKSRQWNKIVGSILGLFFFTPFWKWKISPDIHHHTVGNLDERGVGDVKTFTVKEYLKLPKSKRRFYKFYRHPLLMFPIGGLFIFLIQNRFSSKDRTIKEHLNVHLINLIMAAIVVGISLMIGFKAFILIELPILLIASAAGVSLFYIQHQFDDVQWERKESWDYKTMALKGSSYFKLPKILQWFTGNIGIHHIHHLSPKIPNYYLQKCLNENEEFHIKPITIKNSFKSLRLRLWDEDKNQIVSFKSLQSNEI